MPWDNSALSPGWPPPPGPVRLLLVPATSEPLACLLLACLMAGLCPTSVQIQVLLSELGVGLAPSFPQRAFCTQCVVDLISWFLIALHL